MYLTKLVLDPPADYDIIYRLGETHIYIGEDGAPVSTQLTLASDTIVSSGIHSITTEQSGKYLAIRRDQDPTKGYPYSIGYDFHAIKVYQVPNLLEEGVTIYY